MYPRELEWDTTDYLIASVVDLLAVANYQRAGKKGKKPKPLPRPKVPKPGQKRRKAIPLDEMREHLGWD